MEINAWCLIMENKYYKCLNNKHIYQTADLNEWLNEWMNV